MSDIAAIITASTALVAVVGGYVQFVVRRTLLPCLEFDVEFLTLSCSPSDQSVGEILCKIRNRGPAVGYVTNVRCRVRYRITGESGEMRGEPRFPHELPPGGFLVLDPEKRFIQPGVTQWYRKPLALPANTCLIHVWGRFEYELSAGIISEFVGSLVRQPHEKNPIEYVVRRTFSITDDAKQQSEA